MADKKISKKSSQMMNKDSSFSQVPRPKALKKLKKEMREKGVGVHTDEEAQALLDYFAKQKGIAAESMHAVTLGDDIFVRLEYADNVRVLREEFIHTQQQRKGQSSNQIVEAEIEAREMIIKNRREWEITDEEVREMIIEIRRMREIERY